MVRGPTTLCEARSPQARGSTVHSGYGPVRVIPFPAGAGINRLLTTGIGTVRTVPRRRGDQPTPHDPLLTRFYRSPQARGSTDNHMAKRGYVYPFPAGAGINRSQRYLSLERRTVPRRRGDQPDAVDHLGAGNARSPQARGSTGSTTTRSSLEQPFPAGAGINRVRDRLFPSGSAVPRRRGDQPAPQEPTRRLPRRSPQARGSTAFSPVNRGLSRPFPAGAGINRCINTLLLPAMTVPRRRGDQPPKPPLASMRRLRSPQARGSTVTAAGTRWTNEPFPAGAGINRDRTAN